MRPEAKRTGNLWRGPGVICGALPIGHRLQLATGEPCAFGDTLPADGVAILVAIEAPPPEPTYHPLASDTIAIREKRERLWGLMNDCPACDPWDVYDVPEEQLDRDIAAHGGGRA